MTHELPVNGDVPATPRPGTRFEEVAWACALIMTGALWLSPDGWVPEGSWLAGVGLILLGLNVARRLQGLRMNGAGIVVGLAALTVGIARIWGGRIPFVPLLLVGLGTAMIVNAVVRREPHDGAVSASGG